jgi:hypothetical protein
MSSSTGGLDSIACLRQGCIGALGAIPGTMCAHPMDVLKIRWGYFVCYLLKFGIILVI